MVKKKLLVFCITLCFLLISNDTSRTNATVDAQLHAPAATTSDWPQLAHDSHRSNATNQSVAGPYRFYWRWTSVPLAGRVQPVVANNRLFIGGLNNIFYALDAAYDAAGSEPHILWQHDLGSPIRAGAGVDGGIVIAGTHHGTIYGLDAASGATRWSLVTGGAILAAPLIANGVAYLGSADGWFYALRTSNGKLLWKVAIGVPILGSAALSSDGSHVFFVAENVKAYALASLDGKIVWQTQLQGQSGADRWPVVLANQVIFRTMPLRFFHDLLHDGDDVMDSAGARQANWGADWSAVRPQIVQHLKDVPVDQTFFALDAGTGQTRGVAPVLYTFGNNDPPAPPTIYDSGLYLPYRARHGIQNDSSVAVHVTSRYDAELGRMDPTSLDMTGLNTPDTFDYQFRLTSDESSLPTVAGNTLLVDSWERLGSIDLPSGHLAGVAEVAHDFPECYVQCEANDASMPFYDSYPFPGPRVGEGHSRTGAVVAAGRIFWRVMESGLAAIGPGVQAQEQVVHTSQARFANVQPAKRKKPTPTPAAPSIATPDLRTYVWSEPQRPASVPDDLRARLDDEVGRIVEMNEHLLPFYLERGFHGVGSWPPDTTNPPGPTIIQNSRVYWYDPGELILSLARTYPYLSSPRQEQVRAYLQAEMTRYPPLESLPYGSQAWLKQGQARETYAVNVPPRTSWSTWPPPDVPIQTIYALWAYARATGDWSYVTTHWGTIHALFDAKKQTIDSYAAIAGAIGYARIGQQLGDSDAAAQGESVAVAAMQAGLDFAAWRDRANNLYPDPRDVRTGQRGQVFFGLTPEVGRYLHDTNLQAVQATLDETVGYPNGSYLWYATRLGIQAEKGESSYHTPELAWSIFLTQADVLGANQEQLRYWLDRPWGLGDVWYLQKLVATLEAISMPVSTPSPSPSPSAAPPEDTRVMCYLPLVISCCQTITRQSR